MIGRYPFAALAIDVLEQDDSHTCCAIACREALSVWIRAEVY